MTAILIALVTALPDLLRLINLLAAMVHDTEQRGIGRTAAIKEVLEQAHKELAIVEAERMEADQAHQDPTDDAFLSEWERK